MENRFWDSLIANPMLVFVVICGVIFAVAALLNAITKIHGILGYKTRYELDREDYLRKEEHREQTFVDMCKDIKDMRKELNESFKVLGDELDNVKKANIMFLGDRISQRSSHYLQIGGIPAGEVQEYQAMYETYKSIGGNHGIDTIFEKTIDSLPLINKEDVEDA